MGVESARLVLGAMMVVSPGAAAAGLGAPAGPRTNALVRLLGTRDVLQALVLRDADARRHAVGAGVDAVHGLSAVGLACLSRRHRTAGLRAAWLAGTLCLSEIVAAGRAPR